MYKIKKSPCDQCLFTSRKIVSDARRQQLIKQCKQKDNGFICHKNALANMEDGGQRDEEVYCRAFYDAFPYLGQLRRIAERLGFIEEVE